MLSRPGNQPGVPMFFRIYRSLMPREPMFVDAFVRHSRKIVEAAAAFEAMVAAPGAAEAAVHYERLVRVEDEADTITRETILGIRRVFVTPFDRSDIRELINGMDDIIDLMKDTGRRGSLYGMAYTPQMVGMAGCVVRAAAELERAMPLLSSIAANAETLHAACARVGAIESEADDLMASGLAAVFAGTESPGAKLTAERLYDLIEEVVDRCEDVADCIDGIVAESV